MEFYVVKESIFRDVCHRSKFVIALFTLVALTAITATAQTASEAEAMQKRLMRARALAAFDRYLNEGGGPLEPSRRRTI